jgi:type IV pilus assembly protein PilM
VFSRFRSRNSAITFDVGAAGIRAFQVTARGSHVARRDSLRLDLLAGKHAAEGPAPDYGRLARLVGQGSFSGNDVALILSPPEVRFYALRLPKKALTQPENRLREALAWEVAREMRADAHALEVRHWPLPPGHQQGLNVMAVALPIERALEWYDLLGHEGLRLRRLDVSPCALVHLARRIWTPAENELWGVLDLGFRRATLTVVLGETPAYIRTLPTSCGQWTQRLAEAFEVESAEAEQIKRAHGIQPSDRGIRAARLDQALLKAQDIPNVIFGLLRESLDDLTREINLCFAYVVQNFRDANASRLLLAGGGAKLGGLAEYLEIQLGLPVMALSSDSPADPRPWERPLAGLKLEPEAAVALGGAILDAEAA